MWWFLSPNNLSNKQGTFISEIEAPVFELTTNLTQLLSQKTSITCTQKKMLSHAISYRLEKSQHPTMFPYILLGKALAKQRREVKFSDHSMHYNLQPPSWAVVVNAWTYVLSVSSPSWKEDWKYFISSEALKKSTTNKKFSTRIFFYLLSIMLTGFSFLGSNMKPLDHVS